MKRMFDAHSWTWLCAPCVVHLASWQNGTQRHPETWGEKKKKKKKLNGKKGGK